MIDRIDDLIGDIAELTFNVLALGVMGISGKAVYEGVKEKSWTDLPTAALPFMVSAWWVSQQPWHHKSPVEIINDVKSDISNLVDDAGDDWDEDDEDIECYNHEHCPDCEDCLDENDICDNCGCGVCCCDCYQPGDHEDEPESESDED